jgi:hypothetical protein
MREEAKRPRRLWLWLTLGVVAAVALVATGVALGQRPVATPTVSPSNAASSSPSALPSRAEPDGCLGGAARDANMLATAVNSAGNSQAGAVGVAASFVRWIQRFPYPTAQEAQQVGTSVLAKQSFTSDLPGYLAAKPDLSGGIVPSGTKYFMNTVPGVWYVESSNPDRVVVAIGSGYVIDGSLSSTLRSSITITLTLQDDRWTVADAKGVRTPAELYKLGHPFTRGC